MSKKKLTIEELEALLNSEDEAPLNINPDGTVSRLDGKPDAQLLTAGKPLGGEY